MFDMNNNLLHYGISVNIIEKRGQVIGGFNYEKKKKGLRSLTKYWVKF